jgi:hypothetical protein
LCHLFFSCSFFRQNGQQTKIIFSSSWCKQVVETCEWQERVQRAESDRCRSHEHEMKS